MNIYIHILSTNLFKLCLITTRKKEFQRSKKIRGSCGQQVCDTAALTDGLQRVKSRSSISTMIEPRSKHNVWPLIFSRINRFQSRARGSATPAALRNEQHGRKRERERDYKAFIAAASHLGALSRF